VKGDGRGARAVGAVVVCRWGARWRSRPDPSLRSGWQGTDDRRL